MMMKRMNLMKNKRIMKEIEKIKWMKNNNQKSKKKIQNNKKIKDKK